MILLLVRAAAALDAHGTPAVPSVGSSAAAPVLVWESGAPPTGFAVSLETAQNLVMAWPIDGSAPTPVLDDLVGLTLGGGYRFGRVGLTASLPVWAHLSTPDGSRFGALGDARLAVPVTLWEQGSFALGVRAEGVAPTGEEALLLGGGWAGGVHATAGARGPGWTWTLGAGVAGDTAATYENVDRTVTLPLSGQIGFGGERFGAGIEAWFSPSLTATVAPLSSAPGEALARVGYRAPSGFGVTLAGGYAVSPGIGSAGPRVLARVGWSAPTPRETTPREPEVRVEAAVGGDVVVRARDAAGKPLDAEVRALPRAGGEERTTRLGRDGTAVLRLGPGEWSVEVEAAGKATQTRDVRIEDDPWRPEAVDAVLPPDERGDAQLVLRVVDERGAPVGGAEVRIDGAPYGETSSGGTLRVDGLAGGDRAVTVYGAEYVALDPLSVTLAAGETSRTVTLAHPPGTVKVLARYGDRPAADAQVRFVGPSAPPDPIALGEDGEATVTLRPGEWTAVVTAPNLGLQERAVMVEPGAVALLRVEVRLAPDEGDASLGVRVVDPTGAPVEGAEVSIDGVSVGRTSSGGALRVEGLAPGEHTLAASGPLLRAAERTLTLGGARDVDLVLGWAAGAVAVRARGPEGEPLDAAVRFSGRVDQPPAALGADGEELFTLPAGEWRVAVSAPSFGLQERPVVVAPDAVTRVDIDAALLREAGDAALALRVTGPAGASLAGAVVRVDGREAGTLAGGSTAELRLDGLAPGKHRVEVDGEAGALGRWSGELTLKSGTNGAEARLDWGERAVRVRAKGPDGAVTDAVARPYGPADRAALPLGPTGEGLLALDRRPGWAVAASSSAYGLAAAELPPPAPPRRGAPVRTGPESLDLVFSPPTPGRARLLVEARGPDGRLAAGATLRVDDVALSAPEGWALLPERPTGPVSLSVEAPGFTGAREDLVLVEGAQERRLRLDWVPRPITVLVTEAGGAPVDAEVRLAGPADVRPGATGADGKVETTVLPGEWQVLVSAPAYGARSVSAVVAPGIEPVSVPVTLDAARVEVTASAVRLDEPIHFAFDEATIQPASFRVLEEVVAALQLHPEIARVSIEGHTDNRGNALYNLDLSQRRAEAVRAWLVERGVAPGRLVAVGYGDTRPVATNDTEAGRGANRRVQLVITDRTAGAEAP